MILSSTDSKGALQRQGAVCPRSRIPLEGEHINAPRRPIAASVSDNSSFIKRAIEMTGQICSTLHCCVQDMSSLPIRGHAHGCHDDRVECTGRTHKLPSCSRATVMRRSGSPTSGMGSGCVKAHRPSLYLSTRVARPLNGGSAESKSWSARSSPAGTPFPPSVGEWQPLRSGSS